MIISLSPCIGFSVSFSGCHSTSVSAKKMDYLIRNRTAFEIHEKLRLSIFEQNRFADQRWFWGFHVFKSVSEIFQNNELIALSSFNWKRSWTFPNCGLQSFEKSNNQEKLTLDETYKTFSKISQKGIKGNLKKVKRCKIVSALDVN